MALGVGAGFLGSVVATVRNSGDVYFDSVTMFIFLLLCSRYLELVARRRAAGSLETMQHALPASAWLLKNYELPSFLQSGDGSSPASVFLPLSWKSTPNIGTHFRV